MESNAQKVREAARHLLCVIEEMGFKPWCADDPLAIACDKLDAALALPLSNADVGTAEGQEERFMHFCMKQFGAESHCMKCPLHDMKGRFCQFAWAQMPYEEGGTE